MSEEEPETKDWLGKNVEDGVTDDLGVDTQVPRAIRDTPNARQRG